MLICQAFGYRSLCGNKYIKNKHDDTALDADTELIKPQIIQMLYSKKANIQSAKNEKKKYKEKNDIFYLSFNNLILIINGVSDNVVNTIDDMVNDLMCLDI